MNRLRDDSSNLDDLQREFNELLAELQEAAAPRPPGNPPSDAGNSGSSLAPPPNPGPIEVRDLVLSVRDGLRVPQNVRTRIAAETALPENTDAEALLEAALERHWYSGAMGTLLASRADTPDQSRERHQRALLFRPVPGAPGSPAPSEPALALTVWRVKGRFQIQRVDLVPCTPAKPWEAEVSGCFWWGEDARYMDADDLDRLQGIPSHHGWLDHWLQPWHDHLEWRKHALERGQLRVRWQSAKICENRVVLRVEENDVLLGIDPDELLELVPVESRRSAKASCFARISRIERSTSASSGDRTQPSRDDLRSMDVVLAPCTIDGVETEAPASELPSAGEVRTHIGREVAVLNTQMKALRRLANLDSVNPRLAEWLLNMRDHQPARGRDSAAMLQEGTGLHLNEGQLGAVEGALAGHDVFFIQGPPGTGKTTVIAEIAARAARAGLRVLIASQANGAVDNALERLPLCARVRPLREAKQDRVREEHQELLAPDVVFRWYASLRTSVDRIRAEREEQLARLHQRQDAVDDLMRAAIDVEALRGSLERGNAELATITDHLEQVQRARERAQQHRAQAGRQEAHLRQVRAWANEDGTRPASVVLAAMDWPGTVPQPASLAGYANPLNALANVLDAREPLARVAAVLEELRDPELRMPEDAERVGRLRTRKRALLDSTSDEDMLELASINRELNEFADDRWVSLTGRVARAAAEAWPEDVPDEVLRIQRALGPDKDTDELVNAAERHWAGAMDLVREADHCLRALGKVWDGELPGAVARVDELDRKVREHAEEREQLAEERDRLASGVERDEERLRKAEEAWAAAWELACPEDDERACTMDAARHARAAVEEAARHHAEERLEQHREAWDRLRAKWSGRLAPEGLREVDKVLWDRFYRRSANVVGVTCHEASHRRFWQDPEHRPFDLVIVDEVSKATLPELVGPLLLGRCAVLVGDHHQLSPMLRERQEMLKDIGVEPEEARKQISAQRELVERSVFQGLFEHAPDDMKCMLDRQYRMHSEIMGLTNAFYDGDLKAGDDQEALDAERTHGLSLRVTGGTLLTPDQPVLFVDASLDARRKPVREEQEGTSKQNRTEVDAIVSMLERLDDALRLAGWDGQDHAFRVAPEDDGRPWIQVLEHAWPTWSALVREQLFREGHVRVGRRKVKPDDLAQVGAEMEVRLRRSVGVISFYGAQVRLLRQRIDGLRRKRPDALATMDIRVASVDYFQGDECSFVLVSLVRAGVRNPGGFVRRYQRINVALSRARELLVITGDRRLWQSVEVELPSQRASQPGPVKIYDRIIRKIQHAGGTTSARLIL